MLRKSDFTDWWTSPIGRAFRDMVKDERQIALETTSQEHVLKDKVLAGSFLGRRIVYDAILDLKASDIPGVLVDEEEEVDKN